MFTGLVERLGLVVATHETTDGRALRISGGNLAEDLSPGDSIAVNGVCQTVTTRDENGGDTFGVVAVGETLRRTTLGELSLGGSVHLERPLRVGDRLGGHWVQGHVDGVGVVAEVRRDGDDHAIRIELPEELSRYVVEKGSIAVDGVSLTVGRLERSSTAFWVHIIPATRERTFMGAYVRGARVNLEVDILAKYVERLLGGFGRDAREETP